MKKLWLIDYECAHWCGGQSYVVVLADSPEHAEELAEVLMQETMYELFRDEYEDEPEYQDECSYTVNSVEEFNETHEQWEFWLDPVQRDNFYPYVED